ncbi:hypothetical protein EDD85DRAFT_974755 [Armillaria nabsnona]|nr:hypothetical protein EDD85DRAFT_974755 [Armillaria nabsnona]
MAVGVRDSTVDHPIHILRHFLQHQSTALTQPLSAKFTNRLAELSVTSRPIIQGLSILAHGYTHFADIVTQCLENHIRRVSPWMKFPAFYLLDMISKNMYDPYARHFAAFVVPLSLETYAARWKSSSSPRELDHPPARNCLALRFHAKCKPHKTKAGIQSTSFRGSRQITKSPVLSELEFILGQKERARQANPYDLINQQHVGVLQQLRKLVETGVSQQELQQILAQWPVQTSFSAPSQSYPPSMAPPPPPADAVPAFPPLDAIESKPSILSCQLRRPSVVAGVVSNTCTPVGAGETTKEDKAEPDNAQRSKRKVDEMVSTAGDNEAEGSPPAKKLALTTWTATSTKEEGKNCKRASGYAPEWQQNRKPIADWSVSELLEYFWTARNAARLRTLSWSGSCSLPLVINQIQKPMICVTREEDKTGREWTG